MFTYDKNTMESNPFSGSPFVRFTQISNIPCSFPWTTYPHFHTKEYELVFIAQGEGLLQLPGISYPLTTGSIALIPPNIAHYYQEKDGSPLVHSAIRFSNLENGSPLAKALQYFQPIYVLSKQITQIKLLLDMGQRFTRENGGVIDQKVQTLCLLILEMVQEEFTQSGIEIVTYAPEYANDLLVYLQNHIYSKVTLEEISRHFSLSQSHLSRVFLKTYHISPINYLIYCRMRQARTYILNGNLPPSEIARRLAYKTTYHFTKAFEKFHGCRPEEYQEYEQKIMLDNDSH